VRALINSNSFVFLRASFGRRHDAFGGFFVTRGLLAADNA